MNTNEITVADVLNLLDEQAADTPRRGRPPKGAVAQTSARRQSDLRNSYETAINEAPSGTWSDAVCRHVLDGQKWRGTPIDEQAWLQLGKLRGFRNSDKTKSRR